MSMNCLLLPSGDLTGVVVDSDIQLSGTIAQFGSTGLISEVANALVANFVRNAEAELGVAHSSTSRIEAAADASAAKTTAGSPIGGIALLTLLFKGLFRSMFRRSGGKSESQ
jgi:hypothetical protein